MRGHANRMHLSDSFAINEVKPKWIYADYLFIYVYREQRITI